MLFGHDDTVRLLTLPAAWGLGQKEFLPLPFRRGLLQVYPDILDGCTQ
jgi:hypothetical protein